MDGLARLDARWFQILFLSSFLAFGALARDFSLSAAQVVLTFAVGLASQAAWQFVLKLPARGQLAGYLSAAITCFGVSILVRAENLWVHPLVICLAMSSKYAIRIGRPGARAHLFNPANLAACAAACAVPGAWLSQAQWGSNSVLALWLVAFGGVVAGRIRRLDISLGFLSLWGALLAARLAVLGYAWDPGAAMWLQQMSNGALPLFAFFMISDPMTTPRHRAARLTYALLVALTAFVWQFVLFRGNGLITALFCMSPAVPLLNHVWPAARFEWRARQPRLTLVPGGTTAQVRVR